MKVIELLNKIANGEEVPRKVKYKTYYWEYKQERKDYKDNEDDWVFSCSNYDIPEMLNVEVEIIEEDEKIEKLYGEPRHIYTENELYIVGKINEIIDKLNAGVDKE